jgi:nucleotide-binding universal stress UspA family protein
MQKKHGEAAKHGRPEVPASRSNHSSGRHLRQNLSDKNVNLIVVGTQGHRGITKLFLGSTAERVIRHACCPVLTVGPQVPSLSLNRFGHILCASDFCFGSKRALNFAVSLAVNDRARLILLHVAESDPRSQSELLEWKRLDREKLRQMIAPDADLACEPEIEVMGAARLSPECLQRPWAAPYRISSPGIARRVSIKTRSIISSAQSPYNVCTVLRQPARLPRRNSAWKLAGFLWYSVW